MIQNDSFWDTELAAPLLNRNAGYITRESVEKVVQRAKQWVDLVEERGLVELPTWKTKCDHEASQRIFELDAERTFKSSNHRQDLIETLSTIYDEIQDYHQGMGFIVSFLLLFLEKQYVAKLVLGLDRYYVQGYFKSAPVAYVRDAKAYEQILLQFFPTVHAHITTMIPAEAYCSKWFVGFNVHVLPFAALADFLDAFLSHGQEFQFQYAMAVIKNTQHAILTTQNVGKVLALLRLDVCEYPDTTLSIEDKATDHPTPGSFFTTIIEDATEFDLSQINLETIRQDVLIHMAEEQEKRQKREAELDLDDEIIFSDEEET